MKTKTAVAEAQDSFLALSARLRSFPDTFRSLDGNVQAAFTSLWLLPCAIVWGMAQVPTLTKQIVATVSSKGRLVIPAAIRASLGIEAGTRVSIRQEGSRLILELQNLEAKLRLIDEMCGVTAGGPSMTDMLLEDRRLEHQRELEKDGW